MKILRWWLTMIKQLSGLIFIYLFIHSTSFSICPPSSLPPPLSLLLAKVPPCILPPLLHWDVAPHMSPEIARLLSFFFLASFLYLSFSISLLSPFLPFSPPSFHYVDLVCLKLTIQTRLNPSVQRSAFICFPHAEIKCIQYDAWHSNF